MAYATQSDIVEIYGEHALVVADRNGDGTPDAAAITRALTAAADEIDSHLAVRYPLPLASTPGILRQLSVDVAVYRLAQTADVLTEEVRQRYEDAVAHLRRLAEGKAALVFPPSAPGEGEEPDPLDASPQPIVVAGPPRLFSRERMRDL
ncbi:DUF1320 domain-containing protein [Amaricoccus sp. HAR-UPW-R2A-40]|nr:DUF1320 domain-containing protein [Amaricoccus sp. HAR-UPW-R2A-40]